MFGRKKRCEFCGAEIEEGEEISANVRVYGRSDTPKRHFCSEEHLEKYNEKMKKLLGKRKPGVRCTMCMRY
jgi:ribosomal protein L24E